MSIPDGVSAIRGVPRPERGLAMTVLVTKAPSSVMSKKRCSSRPLAAQPEAVMTGLGSRPRRGGPTWSSGPSVTTRRRADRIAGHPAYAVVERVPAHPVAPEDRALDAGADHRRPPVAPTTGMTQVMHTPMPQAMASSTATWATAPCGGRHLGDARSIAIGPHA